MKFIQIDIIKSTHCEPAYLNLSAIVLVFINRDVNYIIRTEGYDYKVAAESYYRVLRELGINYYK